MSGVIAYAIVAFVLGVASISPRALIHPVLLVSGILLLFGVFCWLKTALTHRQPLMVPSLDVALKPNFKYTQIATLLLGQSALLIISLAFFYLLERQTQLNARLQVLETGYLVDKLQQHFITLGLLPWLTYSVVGIGLAYLSIVLGRQPSLSRSLSLKPKRKIGYFINNLFRIAADTILLGPYLFLVSFTLVWLIETFNALMGWDSLFLKPLGTTFICGLMILVFRKSNKQLIAWMERFHISVGKFFVIYILAFAFFMLWLHGFGSWFTLGQEVSAIGAVKKSVLAGDFKAQALEARITFLIWGWWSIWAPWMASLIARSAVGFGITRAFLQSILLPLLAFGWGIPSLTAEKGGAIAAWLGLPSGQIIGAIGLLLFISLAWGKQKTLGDVLRGAMWPVRQQSKRPLDRWMTMMTLWLACYIPGWFMLGWLPLQVLVTLGGFFMVVVIAVFIGAWGAVLFPPLLTSCSVSCDN